MPETDRAPDAPDEKLPRGCLTAIVLLGIAILGLARGCYLPGSSEETFAVEPGASWKLTVPTNLTTVKGLCRLEDAAATLQLTGEDESLPVPVTCEKQDRWGQIEVEIVTIKGVPVTSGREDVTLAFRFELPDRKAWTGPEGRLRVTGTLVYPHYEFGDVVASGITKSLTWEERRLPYEGTWTLVVADSDERMAERRLDGGFIVLGILALIFAFFGARKLPKPQGTADEDGVAGDDAS